MSLFRKKALDALSTPEQLDQPLQLLRPGYWALLFALLGFGSYILMWSILGRLPIRIKGKGVLTTPNTMHLVQAATSGRVKSIPVDLGKCFETGDTLAKIEPVKLELQQSKVEDELDRLLVDDLREHEYANKRLTLQLNELERWQKVADNGGYISVNELDGHVQKTRALEHQI
ncbi:MAG: biotin/lipoyl-binding protein, partial [bacterium]|nr:biotin/lipoyl-binding protein [bacterium]